jgi:hypothetical protein
MDVVSTSPLRVASSLWQPRAGAWALTVVCKATFRIEPGVSPLADAQEAPDEEEAHWDDDPARSLRAPGDLAPFKAGADVLVTGHAFAPAGQPARTLPVRVQAGAVDKRIDVWCDRIFWQDGQLLEGRPFARMPLRWERAAGGPGTVNPVGLRFDAPPDARGAVPVPNLQPAGVHVARRGDTFAPAGLGPVAAGWPGRAGKLGKHAAGWSHARWRERPLPPDLDRAYFNTAPPDQRLPSIEPDERIVIEHLHPDHPRLETQLPGVRPVARLTSGGRAGEDIALVADTLWIDTDRGIAMVVWRGRVPLRTAAEEGRVTVSHADAGALDVGGTLRVGAEPAPAAPVLPFGVPDDRPRAATVPIVAPGDRSLPFAQADRPGAPKAATLPFAPGKSPWSAKLPPPSPIQEAPADTGTIYGVQQKAYAALPAAWAAPKQDPPAPAAAVEIDDEPTPPAPERAAPEPLPLAPPPVAPPAVEPPAVAPPAVEPPAPEPTAAPEPQEQAPPEDLPIERCAAIAASIARRPADRSAILEAEGIAPEAWAAGERRWSAALKEEASRGKRALLGAYDAAYVGRLEEERGPIGIPEYARLVVAGERGRTAAVLRELGLPRGAMVRIERVWLRKVAADAGLSATVRRAVKAARDA